MLEHDESWADWICERVKIRGQYFDGLKEKLISLSLNSGYPPHVEDTITPQEREVARIRAINYLIDQEERSSIEWEWKQRGVNVTVDTDKHIDSIKVEFTPDEWYRILNRNGDLLGTCCADVSDIRTILKEAICNDGFVNSYDFSRLARLIDGHFEEGHELYRICTVFKMIENTISATSSASSD